MSDVISMLQAKIIDVENARGPAKHILNDRLADLAVDAAVGASEKGEK